MFTQLLLLTLFLLSSLRKNYSFFWWLPFFSKFFHPYFGDIGFSFLVFKIEVSFFLPLIILSCLPPVNPLWLLVKLCRGLFFWVLLLSCPHSPSSYVFFFCVVNHYLPTLDVAFEKFKFFAILSIFCFAKGFPSSVLSIPHSALYFRFPLKITSSMDMQLYNLYFPSLFPGLICYFMESTDGFSRHSLFFVFCSSVFSSSS